MLAATAPYQGRQLAEHALDCAPWGILQHPPQPNYDFHDTMTGASSRPDLTPEAQARHMRNLSRTPARASSCSPPACQVADGPARLGGGRPSCSKQGSPSVLLDPSSDMLRARERLITPNAALATQHRLRPAMDARICECGAQRHETTPPRHATGCATDGRTRAAARPAGATERPAHFTNAASRCTIEITADT